MSKKHPPAIMSLVFEKNFQITHCCCCCFYFVWVFCFILCGKLIFKKKRKGEKKKDYCLQTEKLLLFILLRS